VASAGSPASQGLIPENAAAHSRSGKWSRSVRGDRALAPAPLGPLTALAAARAHPLNGLRAPSASARVIAHVETPGVMDSISTAREE
jgi:hypothetical protein